MLVFNQISLSIQPFSIPMIVSVTDATNMDKRKWVTTEYTSKEPEKDSRESNYVQVTTRNH